MENRIMACVTDDGALLTDFDAQISRVCGIECEEIQNRITGSTAHVNAAAQQFQSIKVEIE
jgi:hypothetical protein